MRPSKFAADLGEPSRPHGRLQPRREPRTVGPGSLPRPVVGPAPFPRPCVQDCVLLEAGSHLIGGVRAERVDEDGALSGDVGGDHHAVPGDRVDLGTEALQGSDAGGARQMAVEQGFGHSGGPAGGRGGGTVGEVALDTEIGREAPVAALLGTGRGTARWWTPATRPVPALPRTR